MSVSAAAIIAGNAVVKLTADDKQLTATLGSISGKIRSTGMALRRLGAISLGIGAAGAPMVATFTSFDDAMLSVAAKTQATTAQLEELQKTALELGQSSGVAATEIAKLMTELGTAGFNPDEVNSMTAAVVNLARATGTEAAVAAKLLGTMTKQFGLAASDATKLADQLTQSANKSAVSVESLTETMAYFGPVAHDLGIATEDALALAGVLGNVGISGSEAGTALRRLGIIAAAGQKEMKALFGVNTLDAVGNVRPLVDILGDIQVAVKDLPTGEKAKKLEQAFGMLGITSASALARSTLNVRDLREEVVNSAGVAAETAARLESGLGGQWRKLKGSAEAAAITFGGILAPAIGSVAEVLKVGAKAFGDWAKQNAESIAKVVRFVGGILAAVAAVKLFGVVLAIAASPLTVIGVALGVVVSSLRDVVDSGDDSIKTLTGIAVAVVGIIAAVKVLGVTIALLSSPFTLVVAAVAGLIILFVKFTDVGKRMASGFLQSLNRIGAFFLEVFGGIVAAIRKGDLELAWNITLKAVDVAFLNLIEQLQKAWHNFGNFFRDTFRDVVTGVQTLMLNLVTAIQTGFLDAIVSIIDAANRAAALLADPTGKVAEMQKDARNQKFDIQTKSLREAREYPQKRLDELSPRVAKAKIAYNEAMAYHNAEEKKGATGQPYDKYSYARVVDAEAEMKHAAELQHKFWKETDAIDKKMRDIRAKIDAGDANWINPAPFRDARENIQKETDMRLKALWQLDQAERDARNRGQEEELANIRERKKLAQDELTELLRQANMGIAPMPREAGGIPMPREAGRKLPTGNLMDQLGTSVKGLYGSADYQGALALGKPNVEKEQLRKLADIHTTLGNIESKMEPGVFT